jgi:hypothetical protein
MCEVRSGDPFVIVFVGVNGVGKSTSLSKVAYLLKTNGLSVSERTSRMRSGRRDPCCLCACTLVYGIGPRLCAGMHRSAWVCASKDQPPTLTHSLQSSASNPQPVTLPQDMKCMTTFPVPLNMRDIRAPPPLCH